MLRISTVDFDVVYQEYLRRLYKKVPIDQQVQSAQTRVNIPDTQSLVGMHIDYPDNIIRPTKEEYNKLLYSQFAPENNQVTILSVSPEDISRKYAASLITKKFL